MANKPYSIVITDIAELDMDGIYDYITNQLYAKPSADKLIANIKEKIMRLQEFPLSCPVIPKILPDKEYRRLQVDNYLVFYRVNEVERQVIIARVLYASQNYMQILS